MSSLVGTRRARSLRRRASPVSTSRVNPYRAHRYVHGSIETVPDPIEFVISDAYLDRPNLYPRQATWLKVMFLRDDMFTQYDHDVIGEWEETFLATGNEGISPGIMDRIAINKANGRPWFRETLGVIGRRGSKGYSGALAGAFVLWNYMHRPGGPQEYYGIDRDKRLAAITFAGKKEQAAANQWRDIFNVVIGGPCFSPYISRPQAERLTVFAPTDIIKAERLAAMGVDVESDQASFEIIPAPSTVMAARGPAAFMFHFDEMAHVVNSTANADAEAVYDASTPALDQFKKDGFIYAPSSPWRKTGKFFQLWEQAIEMEPNGQPTYPEKVMLQLPSWGPYLDWEEADRIPLRPPTKTVIEVEVEIPKTKTVDGKAVEVIETETQQIERLVPGPCFKPLKSAVQTYDDQMRQLERANPDTFKVERRSHWAESLDAYLNAMMVDRMFEPWEGRTLYVAQHGILSETYKAHGDPANTNKRFGWSLAHRVWDDEKKMYHVVFDQIRCWDPADYEDHLLDYDDVMGDIEQDVKTFMPEDVSFDQFNVPATIGRLRKYVAREDLPKHVGVREVSRTRQLNWRHYEMFKAAINMGLVHAPMYRPPVEGMDPEVNYASSEVQLELKFLEEKNGAVDHPSTGPVQTKDIADTLCEVVVALIGKQMATFLGQELDAVGIGGSAAEGTDPYRNSGGKSGNDAAHKLGALTKQQATTMGRGMGSPSRGMRRR